MKTASIPCPSASVGTIARPSHRRKRKNEVLEDDVEARSSVEESLEAAAILVTKRPVGMQPVGRIGHRIETKSIAGHGKWHPGRPGSEQRLVSGSAKHDDVLVTHVLNAHRVRNGDPGHRQSRLRARRTPPCSTAPRTHGGSGRPKARRLSVTDSGHPVNGYPASTTNSSLGSTTECGMSRKSIDESRRMAGTPTRHRQRHSGRNRRQL